MTFKTAAQIRPSLIVFSVSKNLAPCQYRLKYHKINPFWACKRGSSTNGVGKFYDFEIIIIILFSKKCRVTLYEYERSSFFLKNGMIYA